MDQDINVIALVKGNERFVFLYNEANRAEILRTLGRYASNPEINFTWYDAAVLSQRIRQENADKKKSPKSKSKHSDMHPQSSFFSSDSLSKKQALISEAMFPTAMYPVTMTRSFGTSPPTQQTVWKTEGEL